MTILRISLLATLLIGCIRPGEERPEFDNHVGRAVVDGLRVEVGDGLAAVRAVDVGSLVLWAQAPTLQLTLERESAGPLELTVLNCMPGAQVRLGATWSSDRDQDRPTTCIFDVDLAAGENQLLVAPPDFEQQDRYRFAVMGDVQTALDTVHEVFEDISATPELRFVVCTGDIVQDAEEWEYELYQEQLGRLDIPIFATVGNHEVRKPPGRWHELFGLFSVHFQFKGVDFTLVDSGNASVDPTTYTRLDRWLENGRERVHVFGTHFPPLDPVGGRNASFRSRNEGAKLLTRLAEGQVDLMLFGHIHSFYSYENAGIPAFVSGGGGATPELYEGIGRHFLAVRVDPGAGIEEVEFMAVNERGW